MIKCSLYNSDCHFKKNCVWKNSETKERTKARKEQVTEAVRKDEGEINEFWGDTGLKPDF